MKIKKILLSIAILVTHFSLFGMEKNEEVQKYNPGIHSFMQLLPTELMSKLLQDYGCPELVYWILKNQILKEKNKHLETRWFDTKENPHTVAFDSVEKKFWAVDQKKIHLLDFKNNKIVQSKALEGANILCFYESNNNIFFGTSANKIHLNTKFPIKTLDLSSAPCSLLFDDNTNDLYIGLMNGSIRVYNLSLQRFTATFKAHNGAIKCLIFDKKKERIFSGSADYFIKVWDLKNKTCTDEFRLKDPCITCLAFDEKNDHILVGSKFGFVSCFNLATKRKQEELDLKKPILNIQVIPLYADNFISVVTNDGIVRLYKPDLEFILNINNGPTKFSHFDESNFNMILLKENELVVVNFLNAEMVKNIFNTMTDKKYLCLKAAYEYLFNKDKISNLDKKKEVIIDGYFSLPDGLQQTMKLEIPALAALNNKRLESLDHKDVLQSPLKKRKK